MLIAATFFIIFGILGVQVKICKAITVTSTCNILHCHFIKDSVFMGGSLMTSLFAFIPHQHTTRTEVVILDIS